MTSREKLGFIENNTPSVRGPQGPDKNPAPNAIIKHTLEKKINGLNVIKKNILIPCYDWRSVQLRGASVKIVPVSMVLINLANLFKMHPFL